MRKISQLLPLLLLLSACSTPGQTASSPSPSASPSAGPSAPASAMPSGAPSPAADALKGATIEVTQDGKPLKVEPKLADNDYGYQRDFVFGKYTVAELAGMPDDEVGVVWSDGNLADNSSDIKLRLNLSKGRIYEVSGRPDAPNTANMPGACTQELSADKKQVTLYTYKGKLLDTGNARKPTAEEYTVTIRNLDVTRK